MLAKQAAETVVAPGTAESAAEGADNRTLPPVEGVREPSVLRKSFPVRRIRTHCVFYDAVIISKKHEQTVTCVGNIGEQITGAAKGRPAHPAKAQNPCF